MKVLDTPLPGLKQIRVPVYRDDRGCFLETFQAARYAHVLGPDVSFVQDNCSHSRRGVLRGLHYQVRQPQGKLIRVVLGRVFDVVVDVRPASPAFGRWHGVMLTGADGDDEAGASPAETQLWVPPGFAHGFLVLSDHAIVEYKCTQPYRPDDEACLAWDDIDVAIAWPPCQPLLSEKDQRGLSLQALRQAGRLP